MPESSGPSARGAVTVTEHEFARDGDRDLVARVYQAAASDGDAVAPGVVLVSGGHWVGAGLEKHAAFAMMLAEAGVTTASIDFRQPPEVVSPGSVADLNCGIRWFKSHAEQFGTAPARIGGVGFSSGGHLMVLTAMRPTDPRYTRLAPLDGSREDAGLAFAALCYPVVNPLLRYQLALETGKASLVAGTEAYFGNEAEMTAENPQLILERGEEVELPPLLVIQGLADKNVPPEMSRRFVDSYRSRSGSAQLAEYADAPHGFLNPRSHEPTPQSLDGFAGLVQFIRDFALW